MKKYFLLILFIFVSFLTYSQSNLYVDINENIYIILEIAELKGAISGLPSVKPFTEKQVNRYITSALNSRDLFTSEELKILQSYLDQNSNELNAATISVKESSVIRTDCNDFTNFHSYNSAALSLKGNLTEYLSYNLNAGLTFDKLNPETFVPYSFTKESDGFHYGSSEVAYSDGINSDFSYSFFANPELSISLLDDKINIGLSRVRHDWGVGDGSLLLSGSARPITAFESSIWLTENMFFSFLVGSLGDWSDSSLEQKMISSHKLDWFPFDWLYLSVWESIVWGKRFELTYLNPVMFYYIGQNTVGDMDNAVMGADVAITINPWAQWYFSIFLDEIEIGTLDALFVNPKNQFAFYSGFNIPLPGLLFSKLTIQYTKIEPYCYTHYPQGYNFFTSAININYTNDGENIGYHLPPNSDEILVEFSTLPTPETSATLKYQLIRHGSGAHENGDIEGDIGIWLDYNNLNSYPDKNFLNDGTYEWIHAATIEGSYHFQDWPVRLSAGYSFVYALNYLIIADNTEIKNIISLKVELF